MNEFQIRALFENRFGGTPESFGLVPVEGDNGVHLAGNGRTLTLSIVNGQQAGWYLDGKLVTETLPAKPVLKPQDPDRPSNGATLRAALG
jgi:hypothetical protein